MWFRYRTLTLFAGLIFGQVLLLAYQIRRPDAGGVRLLRLWGVTAVVPLEDLSHSLVSDIRSSWKDYFALRHVKEENRDLLQQVQNLRLANMQLQEAAGEAGRFRQLLNFQPSVGFGTRAAEVIGGGASADAQVIYINRGAGQGIARNMPVITPNGVVGKISQVLSSTAQVLLITDPESGVGALLADNRIHGSLRGVGPGPLQLNFVLNDEPVKVGEAVLTSGEDQIYPKGLPLGTVTAVRPGPMFQQIQVQPAAQLSRLESVLVITQTVPVPPVSSIEPTHLTAAEQREQALPRVPVTADHSGIPLPAADFIAAQHRAALAARLSASPTTGTAVSAKPMASQPPTSGAPVRLITKKSTAAALVTSPPAKPPAKRAAMHAPGLGPAAAVSGLGSSRLRPAASTAAAPPRRHVSARRPVVTPSTVPPPPG